ncbi:hypothetical protein G9A89_018233 [Geosiphon pyriformis]|nr:hypothetical protein G9A89_018233 [Geosiphon pyriformis]
MSIFLIIFVKIDLVNSYGWVGHKITADIAQRFLTPRAHTAVIELLPYEAGGNLPEYVFSSRLHFWNPPGDNPPEKCVSEWKKGRYDLINAIFNYTNRLDPKSGFEYEERAEALKFLVHFLGDLHQPLHLTSRLRGGNGADAKFDNHKTTLHYVWDSLLICKQICKILLNKDDNGRDDPTEPDPPRQPPPKCSRCELNSEYVENIISLISTLWRDEHSDWIECKDFKTPDHLNFDNSTSNIIRIDFTNLGPKIHFGPPRPRPIPIPIPMPKVRKGICPDYWAIYLQQLNCQVIWKDYELEIDYGYGEFYESIMKSQIIEKLLAISGVRMAAVLNILLG